MSVVYSTGDLWYSNIENNYAIKIDVSGNVLVSTSLLKNIRGIGLSPIIIDKAVNELLKIKSIKLIKAYIKDKNIPSIKSFEKANFVFLDKLIIKGFKSKVYIREA